MRSSWTMSLFIKHLCLTSVAAAIRAACGANVQYREVWDSVFEHTAEAVSHRPENGEVSPYGKAQLDYPHVPLVDVYEEYHPLLCEAWYKVQKVHRPDKFSDRRARGLWVGRTNKVPGGHKILPIEWDAATSRWNIGKVEVHTAVEVYRTKFNLVRVRTQR